MKIRRLLSLLLAAVLCFTVAISLMACEDDPTDEETTTTAGDTVEGGETTTTAEDTVEGGENGGDVVG